MASCLTIRSLTKTKSSDRKAIPPAVMPPKKANPMSQTYHVEVQSFETLQEVQGAWKMDDYAALLDVMEFGDRSGLGEAELREMCLMSLQDQDPDDAAYIVLKHVIGDDLREGQLRNMATEMREEKLWEEYVEPAYHGKLFRVGSLLYAAVPAVFPKPDAVKVTLRVTGADAAAEGFFVPTPEPPLLVRLLAGGMDDRAVLNRLYEEQIKGDEFHNASDMIWSASAVKAGGGVIEVSVLSSGYWLDALERTEAFEAQAFADAPSEE